MSIIFTQPIEEDKLRLAYNNDVVWFYSDNVLEAKSCMVRDRVNNSFNATLYPAPTGIFFFNFKPYVSALINTNNFSDTLQTALNRSDPNSFVYNSTAGTLLSTVVNIEITLADDSTQDADYYLTWLGGAAQPGSYSGFTKNGTYALTPFKTNSSNGYYLKYWQGYPFDISVYTAWPQFTVKNETNLLDAQFTAPGNVLRMVFSDGDDDETLEDLLPLTEGYNALRIMPGSTASATDIFIGLEKVAYKCGVYLKWLNAMGGYSYWLFEDTYSIDRTTKQLGELSRDYYNLQDTFARTLQIGKESQDTLKIIAELLTEDERRIVEGILDSPKIYLFTGKPYARSSYRDWIEVSLKTTSARLKNPRQPLTNFTFDIELPVRYTQTL